MDDITSAPRLRSLTLGGGASGSAGSATIEVARQGGRSLALDT